MKIIVQILNFKCLNFKTSHCSKYFCQRLRFPGECSWLGLNSFVHRTPSMWFLIGEVLGSIPDPSRDSESRSPVPGLETLRLGFRYQTPRHFLWFWIDGWVDFLLQWMDGCMRACMGWVHACINGWMHAWMHTWMDARIGPGWMHGWMGRSVGK